MTLTTINTWTFEVDGTDDNDTFFFNAGAHDVDAGDGNDTVFINNGASITNLDLGNGTNQVFGADAGYIGNVTGGEDTDFVAVGTAGAGNVDLGEGNNQLFARGWVQNVATGNGVDVVELNAGGGTIELGGGSDIFRANGWVNQVSGEEGNDFFALSAGGNIDGGDGDDTFVFQFKNQGAWTTFDGGADRDTVNIVVDSLDDVDLARLENELSGYADSGEATLSQFGIQLTDVEVINIVVDGQPQETYDFGEAFA